METHIYTKAREVFSQRPVLSHLCKFKQSNAKTCPLLFAHIAYNTLITCQKKPHYYTEYITNYAHKMIWKWY